MNRIAFALLMLSGCTAVDRAALRDCAAKVLPAQALAVAVECSTDKECLRREAAARAIAAADALNACMEARDGAAD